MSNEVRGAALNGYSELVTELGSDPALIVKKLGVDPAILQNTQIRIDAIDVINLLNQAAKDTGCSTFGLELGKRRNLEGHLGILGELASSATNLDEAFSDVFRYMEIHSEVSLWQIETKDHVSCLMFSLSREYEEDLSQVLQVVIVMLWRIVHALSGGHWHPTMVAFPFKSPASSNTFKQAFNVPVFFDADYCGIVFHSSDLLLKLETSNEKIHQLLKKRADSFVQNKKQEFKDTVRMLIRKNLQVQKVDEAKVAAFFPFGRRTFQRRLKTEGTNYQRLLAEVRMSVARNMLSRSSTSITRIAIHLGYNDIGNFTKAFSRHAGMPPKAWRSQSQ